METKEFWENDIPKQMREFDRRSFSFENRLRELGLTSKEFYNHLWEAHLESVKDDIEITPEEEAFRRGFSHGFRAARCDDKLTMQDVMNWRNYRKELHPLPPGNEWDQFRV
jgi:hypothetical protein